MDADADADAVQRSAVAVAGDRRQEKSRNEKEIREKCKLSK